MFDITKSAFVRSSCVREGPADLRFLPPDCREASSGHGRRETAARVTPALSRVSRVHRFRELPPAPREGLATRLVHTMVLPGDCSLVEGTADRGARVSDDLIVVHGGTSGAKLGEARFAKGGGKGRDGLSAFLGELAPASILE